MDYVSIGGITVEKTAVLAPMAGVCDYAQRILCAEHGAAIVCGEMASSAGLVYGDKKTHKLLQAGTARPFIAQLFGNKPEYMAEAARITAQYKPNAIDINSGCPMPKITSGGAGAALMRTPELLSEIIRAVVKAVDVPVTVKIRTGWDENSINAVEIAKLCEAGGVSAITVHARTREQYYTGHADWDMIAAVKQAVSVPVIGNGDVTSAEKCREMYERTGCDLVMVGRAAWGAPWLFDEIKSGTPPPSLDERLQIMTRHIDLLIADKGESVAMKQARAHVAKYLRGLKGAAMFRNMCSSMNTRQDFISITDKIKEQYK